MASSARMAVEEAAYVANSNKDDIGFIQFYFNRLTHMFSTIYPSVFFNYLRMTVKSFDIGMNQRGRILNQLHDEGFHLPRTETLL